MTNRLSLDQATIVPWQFPDIDASGGAAAPPAFRETELGVSQPSPAALAPPPVAPRPAPATAHSAPSAAELAAAASRAEGFERGRREGQEQGYAEGMAAGRRAAEQATTAQIERLETIVRRLSEPMRSLERPVEEAVIALALEVARWVIGSQIAVSRDYLVELIREAVARVPIELGAPTVLLHSADAELLRSLAPDLEGNGIPLVADDTVEPGGCRIIATGDETVHKDRRWHPRARQAVCEVDLTLASRWRDAMFAMFEGEDA